MRPRLWRFPASRSRFPGLPCRRSYALMWSVASSSYSASASFPLIVVLPNCCALKCLSYDFPFQCSLLLVIAYDFSLEGDNPPAIPFPLCRNERGVQRSPIAEAQRSFILLHVAYLDRRCTAAIGGSSLRIRTPVANLRASLLERSDPLALLAAPFGGEILQTAPP